MKDQPANGSVPAVPPVHCACPNPGGCPGSGHLRRPGSKSWPPGKMVRAQASRQLAAGAAAACGLGPRRNSSLEEIPGC